MRDYWLDPPECNEATNNAYIELCETRLELKTAERENEQFWELLDNSSQAACPIIKERLRALLMVWDEEIEALKERASELNEIINERAS